MFNDVHADGQLRSLCAFRYKNTAETLLTSASTAAVRVLSRSKSVCVALVLQVFSLLLSSCLLGINGFIKMQFTSRTAGLLKWCSLWVSCVPRAAPVATTNFSTFLFPRKDTQTSRGLSLALGAHCPPLVPSVMERVWCTGVPPHLSLGGWTPGLFPHSGGCAQCCCGHLCGRVPPFLLGLHRRAWSPSHKVRSLARPHPTSTSPPPPFREASGELTGLSLGGPTERPSSGEPKEWHRPPCPRECPSPVVRWPGRKSHPPPLVEATDVQIL